VAGRRRAHLVRPAENVRRRAVRVLRQDALRHAEAARPLETGHVGTNAALGEAVGKLYVERFFPPSEKARAEEMVKNELAAFGLRIDKLDWMAPETKTKAKAKLAALKVGVGYPDRWRDYTALEVIRGDALGNESGPRSSSITAR
jgi:predicted metalloendopeptidase